MRQSYKFTIRVSLITYKLKIHITFIQYETQCIFAQDTLNQSNLDNLRYQILKSHFFFMLIHFYEFSINKYPS